MAEPPFQRAGGLLRIQIEDEIGRGGKERRVSGEDRLVMLASAPTRIKATPRAIPTTVASTWNAHPVAISHAVAKTNTNRRGGPECGKGPVWVRCRIP